MYKVENDTYECPVEALSNILGRKWVAEIIWELKIIRLGLENYKDY
ncbi:transcriptional regulator [Clostridium perfringens]|nr:transcriptional regulator [Clostridium perfringens]